MVKKILASVLTLVMAMSIFTFGVSTLAYAAETEAAQEEVQAITADDAPLEREALFCATGGLFWSCILKIS